MDRYEFYDLWKEFEVAVEKARTHYYEHDYEPWVEFTGAYPFIQEVKPLLKKMMQYYFGKEAKDMNKRMFVIELFNSGRITAVQKDEIMQWIGLT